MNQNDSELAHRLHRLHGLLKQFDEDDASPFTVLTDEERTALEVISRKLTNKLESEIPKDAPRGHGDGRHHDRGGHRRSDVTPGEDGICGLCGKNCTLNNPGCNRPYDAGLIR